MSNLLQNFLDDRPWRRVAYDHICKIPSGYLATYGRIAELTHDDGYAISPRNVAWLRESLYQMLGHSSDVPLHRVAKKGDVDSIHDSDKTKAINDTLRHSEGFFANQLWL